MKATTYVFMGKYRKLSLNYMCYPFLSEVLADLYLDFSQIFSFSQPFNQGLQMRMLDANNTFNSLHNWHVKFS